jgi:hypothetical protein
MELDRVRGPAGDVVRTVPTPAPACRYAMVVIGKRDDDADQPPVLAVEEAV